VLAASVLESDMVRKMPNLVGRIDWPGERGAQNNPGLLGIGLEHALWLAAFLASFSTHLVSFSSVRGLSPDFI